MKKVLLIPVLCGLMITVHAQVPNGLDWKALSAGEQTAYAQGFVDAQLAVFLLLQKDTMLGCKPTASEGCLILKWWASIKYVPDADKILVTMNVLYSDARNLCISQQNAFLIAEAMAQGEPISDSDLAVIRKGDVELAAKNNHQP